MSDPIELAKRQGEIHATCTHPEPADYSAAESAAYGEGKEMVLREMEQRSIVPALDTPLLQCPTNLDFTTEVGKACAMNAMSAPDLQLPENGRLDMVIVSYLVHQVQREDPETGEIATFPRTIFFTQSGETFASTSKVIPTRLMGLLSLYTPEEWAKGIPIQVRQVRCRSGIGHYHDIRVLPGNVPAAKTE